MDADEKRVHTICGFCHANCGMSISVKGGRIEKVRGNPEHPSNRGKLCPKGAAAKQIVYSPERLKYPMWKTERGFERISWDEALDRIAGALIEIREKYGPETVLQCRGAPVTEEVRDGFVQLMAAYGSPNTTSPAHLCSVPRRLGLGLVCGERTVPDYENTRCMIVWGANPTDSRNFAEEMAYERFDRVVVEAKKRGAKLIVIDPRRTELAAMADEWIDIAPETDLAFALAMLHVIIGERLYDREFVDNWTLGFDRLKAHVRETTPEWAEGITQVPADRIRKIARMYGTTKPALILDGNGLDQHPNVVQTVRAIGLLSAVTGNIDVPGGDVIPPHAKAAPYPTLRPPAKRLAADEYPLFPRAPYPSMFDALLSGKPYQPRAMIVHHANPLLINANEKRVREALEKLELLIVYDIFESATAKLAHVILPAASDFERFAYRIYPSSRGAFVALQQKVIEPIGESRSVFEVEYELARRMGLEGHFPWKSNEEWVNYKLKPLGVTLEDLQKQPVIYVTPPLEYRKYLKEGFSTPSRKVELYSEKLKGLGQDALPVYKPPEESPDLVSRFPLTATTRRPGNYVHTRFRNVPTLHRLEPNSLVRIHPADAQLREIGEGDKAIIESPQGSITLKARVTPEIRPGLVVVDFGWGNPWDGQANVNVLTSDEARDPISAATSNRRFLCEVRKAPM
jgi:anaerobic selenocysteine-containing dehydrogenase